MDPGGSPFRTYKGVIGAFRGAGFDDKVQDAFFNKSLDSVKGDIFLFSLELAAMDLGNQLSLSQVTSTFHLLLSAEHSCLQFLEMRVYGYYLSVCSVFLLLISSSGILSTEAVLFLEKSLLGDPVHLKTIHGSAAVVTLFVICRSQWMLYLMGAGLCPDRCMSLLRLSSNCQYFLLYIYIEREYNKNRLY